MEILIEHYRLGMTLSMPVVVGDKVLLDSGSKIETEKVMDVIKANGVTKLDVKKQHIPELAKNYPEFYGRHGEEIAKAKASGRQTRVMAADEWTKARGLVPKPPAVSLLARPQDLPDLSRLLMPYFPIEVQGNRFREIADKLKRTRLLVVWVDGFTPDERAFIRSEIKRDHADTKILAVTRGGYCGPWDVVRWMGSGSQVFKAAFLCRFPEHVGAFESQLLGAHLHEVQQPLIHVVTDAPSLETVDEWLQQWEQVHFSIAEVGDAKPVAGAVLTFFYFQNKEAALAEHLKALFAAGYPQQKVLVVVDGIAKEEVEGLKAFGRLLLQMGGLENEKIKTLLGKVVPKA